jgi:hypothetical protein
VHLLQKRRQKRPTKIGWAAAGRAEKRQQDVRTDQKKVEKISSIRLQARLLGSKMPVPIPRWRTVGTIKKTEISAQPEFLSRRIFVSKVHILH